MENRIGFGKRLGAIVLDCVLVGVLGWLVGGTIGGMLGLGAGSIAGSGGDNAAAAAAMGGALGAMLGAIAGIAVVAVAYNLVEGFTGWTLGKLILGIKIANADGTAASTGTLLTRYVLKNGNMLLTLASAIGGIAILRTLGNLWGLCWFVGCFFALGAAKQALHDMIAKTAVYPKAAIH